jgi:hypothetical protein
MGKQTKKLGGKTRKRSLALSSKEKKKHNLQAKCLPQVGLSYESMISLNLSLFEFRA